MRSQLWQRIRAARRFGDVSQEAVGEACGGVSRNAVSLWESPDDSKRTKPSWEQLVALCRLTGAPLDWLLNDDVDPTVPWTESNLREEGKTYSVGRHSIPLLNTVQAGHPRQVIDDYAPGSGLDEIQIAPELASKVGKYTFALVVNGRSMEPEFSEGDIIIVDPGAAIHPGDYVVARLERDEETTLKRYRDRGVSPSGARQFELVPTNPDYAPIIVNEENPGSVVGRVIEHRRRFMRSSR